MASVLLPETSTFPEGRGAPLPVDIISGGCDMVTREAVPRRVRTKHARTREIRKLSKPFELTASCLRDCSASLYPDTFGLDA